MRKIVLGFAFLATMSPLSAQEKKSFVVNYGHCIVTTVDGTGASIIAVEQDGNKIAGFVIEMGGFLGIGLKHARVDFETMTNWAVNRINGCSVKSTLSKAEILRLPDYPLYTRY